jgi:hypothetical protein
MRIVNDPARTRQPSGKIVTCLDALPTLTPHQAYAAMVEFLRIEFELAGTAGEIKLGGLLAEMQIEPNGGSADPGAMEQFRDAVSVVLGRGTS